MAIPAIVLRAATMIRNGKEAKAVKEFSAKVIKEAKKHLKDLKTKKTPGQARSEQATKGQRTYRSGQRKAGAGGAVGGSGVTAAVMSSSGEKNSSTKKTPVKKTTPKKLPLAKEGKIDVVGTGKGMKYYQNGKEVRIK